MAFGEVSEEALQRALYEGEQDGYELKSFQWLLSIVWIVWERCLA